MVAEPEAPIRRLLSSTPEPGGGAITIGVFSPRPLEPAVVVALEAVLHRAGTELAQALDDAIRIFGEPEPCP